MAANSQQQQQKCRLPTERSTIQFPYLKTSQFWVIHLHRQCWWSVHSLWSWLRGIQLFGNPVNLSYCCPSINAGGDWQSYTWKKKYFVWSTTVWHHYYYTRQTMVHPYLFTDVYSVQQLVSQNKLPSLNRQWTNTSMHWRCHLLLSCNWSHFCDVWKSYYPTLLLTW
jgi:hypothetical protein